MKLRSKKKYEFGRKKLNKNEKFKEDQRTREVSEKKHSNNQLIVQRGDTRQLRMILKRVNPKVSELYPATRKMTDHSNNIKPVDALKFEGNLSENWRRFKRNWDIFMIAVGIDTKADVVKINTFLNAIGSDAVEIYDTFDLSPTERATYTSVIKSFADFCTPRKNIVYERYVFNQRSQRLIDIKKLIRTCEFGENENEMLRDRIVIGVQDKKLQAKLLETSNLTHETAIVKCRSSGATQEQTSNMNKTVPLNEILTNDRKSGNMQPRAKQQDERNKNRNSSNNSRTQSNDNRTQSNNNQNRNNARRNNCMFCNRQHKPRQCPAYGQTCSRCSKLNHFSEVCRARIVNTIETVDDNSSDNNEFYVESIEMNVNTAATDDAFGMTWTEKIRINDKHVAFKIDTGAEMNVLPLSVVRLIDPKIELKEASIRLKPFGSGDKITPKGMCSLQCTYNNVTLNVLFAVVSFDAMPILGLATSTRFKIVNPPATATNQRKIKKYDL